MPRRDRAATQDWQVGQLAIVLGLPQVFSG